MTDEELVKSTLAGDKDAFAELVRRHEGVAYGLAYHQLGNFADAEDVAQQAFVAAYLRLETLREPERFTAWLRSIVANECRMWQRRTRETVSFEDLTDIPSEDSPEGHAVRRELQKQVRQAIARLSPANRLAVTLYYLDGESCEEVASFLDVPVVTVKTRLHRARNQLRQEMADMVADTLQEQRRAGKVTETVRRRVPCRVVEPFEFILPLKPTDAVLVYTHDAVVHVQGGDSGELRVEGGKILFGATAGEARARSGQIVVEAKRRRNLWKHAPHDGERWAGTGGGNGQYHAYYSDSKQEWKAWMDRCKEDATLREVLSPLLSGEVVSVVAAGRRIDGLTVPYPLKGKVKDEFRTGFTSGRQGLAYGAAASVTLTVTVPPCANVILYQPMLATVEDVSANLLVLGWFGWLIARRVRGNIYGWNIVPAQVEHVTGDLQVNDDLDHRGVEWEENLVRRVGRIPSSRIRDLDGSTRIRCRNLSLDIAGVTGDLDVENEFGRTRLALDESWDKGHTAEIRSVAGSVTLDLTPTADDQLKVGVWTDCGALDRSRWSTPKGLYNTPQTIYLGTKPEHEGADVRIRTRSGDVRVVRKP
ncbi:MAG: sigma-70 family RNA polymerase sigma factor [Armatimonadetes bacterium]|nr:sigma-70 family RNA polymerase sigma factor [Armatimonadota bacterium]